LQWAQIMRRRVLCLSFPAALLAGRVRAQPRRLELACYSSQSFDGSAAQLFADKAAALFSGTVRIEATELPSMMPFVAIGKASALAFYHAPAFAREEPVLGLSAVPMLAATFDEAETLLRIARPSYAAALARHGQVLLAVEPWRPAALWSTFRLRSARDLGGARFALDATPYAGQDWAAPFARLGTRRSTYGEAEVLLSSGYIPSATLAREFASVLEVFLATQLSFLTANREVFDSLSEAERAALVAVARATEAERWRRIRAFLRRDQQDIAARGVMVDPPPTDLVSALRTAAEPDVRRWSAAMGADGETILADYRRAIGF
jgi:TRAP-type C4-dicarboxylate transport system substrate-binding protein